MIKVGINGFGRIGRAIVRAVFELNLQDKIQIVHINTNNKFKGDFISSLKHLLIYDSVHGRSCLDINVLDNKLNIAGFDISVSSHKDPRNCPWGDLDVDIVFECTGKFKNKADAMLHVQAGAKQVLISAPGGNCVEKTVVYGVNHKTIGKDDKNSIKCFLYNKLSCSINNAIKQ